MNKPRQCPAHITKANERQLHSPIALMTTRLERCPSNSA
jgi:hypothetical protein